MTATTTRTRTEAMDALDRPPGRAGPLGHL